jgi:hypothetical protein
MDISAKFESISLLSIPSDQRAQTLATAVAVAMCHRVADGYDFETDVKPLLLRVCGLMRPIGEVLVDDCIDRYRRMYNAYFQYTQHPATQLRVMTTGTTPYPDLDNDISDGLSHMAKIPGLFELINYTFNKADEQADAVATANDEMEKFTVEGEEELDVEIALESNKENIVVRIWNWIVEQIKAFGKWISNILESFWNWITGNKKSAESSDKKADAKIEKELGGEVKAVVPSSTDSKKNQVETKKIEDVKQQITEINKVGDSIAENKNLPESRPAPTKAKSVTVIATDDELTKVVDTLYSKHKTWLNRLSSVVKQVENGMLRPLFDPRTGRGQFYDPSNKDEYTKNVFETHINPKYLDSLKMLVKEIPELIKGSIAFEADSDYQAVLAYKGLSASAPVNADRLEKLFQMNINIQIGNDSTDILAWMWTLIPSIKAHRSLTDIFNIPKLPDAPLILPTEIVDDINFFNALPNIALDAGGKKWLPGSSDLANGCDLDTLKKHTEFYIKYTDNKKGLLELIDSDLFKLKPGDTLNVKSTEHAGTNSNSTYAHFKQSGTLKSDKFIKVTQDKYQKMIEGKQLSPEETETIRKQVDEEIKVTSAYYAAYVKYQTWLARIVFEHGRAFNSWIMGL